RQKQAEKTETCIYSIDVRQRCTGSPLGGLWSAWGWLHWRRLRLIDMTRTSTAA
ncbi:unnamed protein product, partial [Musa banksii]